MPDNQATPTAGGAAAVVSTLNIPAETREQFPELVPLVETSHSMNDEERQYWIDVLPIMTEDQIQNLRDILGTEKKQIAEANQVYQKGVTQAVKKSGLDFNEATYKAKKEALRAAEKAQETQEKTEEEAVLKEIEGMQL